MYYLDLFSGIGGFALGAYWAGCRFDGHYFSEVDEYAIRIYQQRFPDATGLGDIRNIRGADLPAGEWIIAGGFPCQDISVAGKGAGLAGARSGLWFEYARLIGELRPSYAIMENVGALVGRGLDAVLGSLAEIGYDAEWQDIRASDVGAPHRRERIWIVAYPGRADGETWKGYGMGAGTTGEGAAKETPCRGSREDVAYSGGPGRSPSHGGREWWAVEPPLGCLVDGLPDGLGRFEGRTCRRSHERVNQLKCLGNSIVPQIAELIFREIRRTA